MTVPIPSLKKLSFVSEKRLALYGVAAGAALAAGISPADATSVSLDLTGLPIGDRTTPSNGNLFFDVNAASAAAAVGFAPFAGADFRLNNFQSGFKSVAGVNGTAGINGVAVGSLGKAARFSPSNSVGPANVFASNAKIGDRLNLIGSAQLGNFQPGDTGYIGLRFTIGADTHYGWADLSLNNDYTVALLALGYDTNPDTADHIPGGTSVPDQGSSLALLAVGAAGVIAFRKRQSKTA
ncbi:MAG: hypothetical protein QOG67_776 [Verrucomicrobiota bacterium]|jgi:hypothetical protein